MRFTYLKLLSFLALAIPAFSADILKSDLLGSYEITIDENNYKEAFVYENSITLDNWTSTDGDIFWNTGYMKGTWDFADSKLTILSFSSRDKFPKSQYKITISLNKVTLADLRTGVEAESIEQMDEQPATTGKVWIQKTNKRDNRLFVVSSSEE